MIKRYIPFAHASNVFDIDISFYKKLGIKYLFMDLDNTLDSYLCEKPTKKTIEWKKHIESNGIKIIITSNNTGKRVGIYSKALGVDYLSSIGKPFAFGLNKAIKALKLDKNDIMLIGDQTTTDICAANGAKIKNVLTDKLVKEDQPTTRFNRLFDIPIRNYLKKKNLLKDWREF